MPSFSEARARTSDIPVAKVNAPGVADRATAAGIQAFGQLAGDARKGKLKADLQTELEESSLIVDALNSNEAVVKDSTVDISAADPDGIIDTTSQKFKRLSIARQQGLIDENQVALEGETLLRQAITKAPGFEPEFRKLAADSVGFDVTGAATRTLFGLGRRSASSSRLTALQKLQEEAQALSTVLGLDPDDTLQLVAKRQLQEVEDSIIDSNLSRGRVTAARYGNQSSAEFEASALGALSQALNAEGKVVDTGELKAQVELLHNQHKNRAIKNTIDSNGFIQAESRAEILGMLDASRDSMFRIFDNKDLVTFMSNKRGILANAIAIRGLQLFPEIALLEEVGGQAWVEDYLNNIDLTDGNPSKVSDLIKANPSFAKQLEIIAAADPTQMGGIIHRIQSGTANQVPIEQSEVTGAISVTGMENSMNGGDVEKASSYTNAALDQGLARLPMSVMARRPNGYSLVDGPTQQRVLNTYQADVITATAKLQSELVGTDETLAWDSRAGRFQLMRGGITSNLANFSGLGGAPNPSVKGTDEVKYINEVLVGLQRDQKFRKDAGIVDQDAWAASIVAAVNQEVAPTQFSLDEEIDTTEALQRVEPGVFQDANGNVFRMGEDGEFIQLNKELADSQPTQIEAPRAPDLSPQATDTLITEARSAAKKFGLPENLFLALVQQESSFNPEAESQLGARGLTQLMPAAIEDLAVDIADPKDQLRGGAEYLKTMIDRFGDIDTALAAYNWGPGNVRRTLNKQGTLQGFLPAETEEFIRKIKTNAGIE